MSQVRNDGISSQIEIASQLEYFLMPGKYSGIALRKHYAEIFKFWHDQWAHAFAEIDMPFSESSEEFCRHEEVTGIFLNDRVIAIVLLDYFDLANEVHKRHKYFSSYPPSVLEELQRLARGKPVFTSGYLAIDPQFRRDYHMSDIILGLAVKRLRESPSSIMITFTRNTRRTHDLTYRLGSKAIVKDLIVRGEPSDFVYFDRGSLETVESHVAHPQMAYLWDKKIFIPSANVGSFNQTRKEGVPYEQAQFERSL